MAFSINAVTSSVIAVSAEDPYKVYVIEQAEKHQGRLTLVGGKVKLPGSSLRSRLFKRLWQLKLFKQAWALKMLRSAWELSVTLADHLYAAHEEWHEEAGGKGAKLVSPVLFAVKRDKNSDVRSAKLGRVTDNGCPQELRELPVTGHYGAPDYIFLARVDGTPYPLDGEAKQCPLVDVREIEVASSKEASRFGAQHDLILLVYRLSLAGRPVSDKDFSDFNQLRKALPELLAQWES